ncbi:MAG: hypothetical protein D6768_19070 [Chloroflexi bacterium]|nr:MAG: hypothetical protein D6768_19070 [Chloroflexota bacterium]
MLAGNVADIVEESAGVNIEELQQIQEALATPTPTPAGESAESSGESVGAAEESGSADAVPAGEAEELAGDILGAIQEHIEEGGDEPFSFGCENPTVPMPNDVTGCVSVGGFTTYSTAMSADELNKMYNNYFTGQGWKTYPALIQEEVINAWQGDNPGQLAFLSVDTGGGEGGKNLVTLGVTGAQ